MQLSLSVLLLHAVTITTAGSATSAHGNTLLQVKASAQLVGIVDLNKTETEFIAGVLASFGKQKSDYEGPQTLLGFRSRNLFDEQGMFAFDDSITSVALDVGADTNPLIFDTAADVGQVVLAFEPLFHKTLAEDLETRAKEVESRGGCTSRWETNCVNQRLVVFPSAVSSEIGTAEFRLAANPYCSSLNSVPGDLDPALVNHTDKDVRDMMASCWGSLNTAPRQQVPTVTLASVIRRIPKHIRIKYLKIDAQGQDFKILQSAANQMPRLEYVRFEMQVDPPPGRKMVADIPSYADVVSFMEDHGFVHDSPACHFDSRASQFSIAIEEKDCVFCRELPCRESGVPPLGKNPALMTDA